MTRNARRAAVLALALVACRAGDEPLPAPSSEAPVCDRLDEGATPVVRLDDASIERLGIVTDRVTTTTSARTRVVPGFVVIPPGQALSVTAPVAGTLRAGEHPLAIGSHVRAGDVLLRLVPIAPVDRDLRAQARRQREASKARLDVARARLDRTRTLVEQRGASMRALEEATAELATAEAENDAADSRERMLRRSPLAADTVLPVAAPREGIVRTISAAAGQSIAAGTVLFDVASTTALWVRVPVYSGDVARLAADAPVRVARLGSDMSTAIEAQPVAAPPSADSTSATVDRFYALGSAASFDPGERIAVELGYADEVALASVPAAAIVVDVDGRSWVYECTDERAFRRRPVEVLRHDGERAILARGPDEGTCVVSVGALELFGTEFGVAH